MQPSLSNSASQGMRERLAFSARCLAVASAFSVPLPAAWISVTTGLFLILWLASGNYAQRWLTLRKQPVALISLALFIWMGLSTAWSPASIQASSYDWWLYRELLLIPLLASILDTPKWGIRLLYGFLCGFSIALGVSYLRWFGVLPDMGLLGRYAGFGGHTGFSIMLAFTVWTCLLLWSQEPGLRFLWLGLGTLSLFNLYFVNTGRTGQFIFLFLPPLFAYERYRLKGLLLGIVTAAALATSVYLVSPSVHQRVEVTFSDIQKFRTSNTNTNDGIRMEFWENTATLIARHPVFGGGMGSFRPEYRAEALAHGLGETHVTPNPHNEYLMVWSQTGLVGLALLLALWGVQCYRANSLGPQIRFLTYGLLVTMIVGDAFNSFILDNLEGHFYALLTAALLLPLAPFKQPEHQ